VSWNSDAHSDATLRPEKSQNLKIQEGKRPLYSK